MGQLGNVMLGQFMLASVADMLIVSESCPVRRHHQSSSPRFPARPAEAAASAMKRPDLATESVRGRPAETIAPRPRPDQCK